MSAPFPPPAVLVVSSWLPDDVEEEFAIWCDVHHRGLLTVPGVRRARRFSQRSGSSGDSPDVLVTYEVDDVTVVGTDLWRERGTAHGPLPPSVAAGLRSTSRSMTIAASVPGAWWPPRPSSLLDVFTVAGAGRIDALVKGMGAMAPSEGVPVTVRVLRADDNPALVLIDHDEEDGHDVIDALTDSSGANRSRWTVVFDERSDGDIAIGPQDHPIEILVICSGNTCRSPMAMALLAHHLAARGMDARVHSAGTIGWGGPATGHAVETLAARGIDLSDHESRRMSGVDVAGADLVLGMTRDHVTGALNHDPEARDRTFVIGELARLGRVHGPRRDGESIRDWCAAVAATRPANRPSARSADEIADPVGEGLDVYAATADRLDALCAEIAALLLPRGAHGEVVDIDPVIR